MQNNDPIKDILRANYVNNALKKASDIEITIDGKKEKLIETFEVDLVEGELHVKLNEKLKDIYK